MEAGEVAVEESTVLDLPHSQPETAPEGAPQPGWEQVEARLASFHPPAVYLEAAGEISQPADDGQSVLEFAG